MTKLILTHEEIGALQSLLADLAKRYTNVDDEDWLREASVYAHELPRRVRAFLNDFKHTEPRGGICVISGYPIDEERVGRTPRHWNTRQAVSSTLPEELLLVLYGSLLGDSMGWATQQNGYMIHDVMPVKECEGMQLGTGSLQELWWHSEDAFHPYRGDYLGLMCVRNPDKVPTSLASIDGIEMAPEQVSLLFEPHFTIRPDESHLADNNFRKVEEGGLLTDAFKKIRNMNSSPERISVLFGDPRSPYLRIDPYFMDEADDPRAQSALDDLTESLNKKIWDCVLDAGDYLFIDNYRTVHGRKPFKPHYDGNDRWLKRLNITRDLRKSRDARPSCSSRLLF